MANAYHAPTDSNQLFLDICDSDATNCNITTLIFGGTLTSLDIFDDTINEQIIVSYTSTSWGQTMRYDYNGSIIVVEFYLIQFN